MVMIHGALWLTLLSSCGTSASHHTVTVPTCTVPIVNCTYGHQPLVTLYLVVARNLSISTLLLLDSWKVICVVLPVVLSKILLYEKSILRLKQQLVEGWSAMPQRVIDEAIDEWCRRLRCCVSAEGGHFEHKL